MTYNQRPIDIWCTWIDIGTEETERGSSVATQYSTWRDNVAEEVECG